jgi:hypothetical protein
MIPVAAALGTILQIAGVVNDVSSYVDVILRITQKGENIDQNELDEIIAGLRARHGRIQEANPDA